MGRRQRLGAGSRDGRAVQVEPINPMLKVPGTQRLKPSNDEWPSNIAFEFNLRHFSLERYGGEPLMILHNTSAMHAMPVVGINPKL
jgi:hypothetical protein